MKSSKTRIAGVTAAAVALVGGGAALAAEKLTPKEASDAVVADAAKQLGIEASKLDAALKKALSNRVDAAVEAGQLTEAQGEELKERIADGEVPLVGVGPGFKHHGFGHRLADLDVAAEYLGITEEALKTSLRDGSTLAEIAEEKGKSVDGLKDALVAAAKADLEEAVEDGRLTEAQEAEILADLPDRIDDLVNGELGLRRHGGPHVFGGPPGFFGGPPAAGADDDA
jgi:flagellar hook-length control protein FliK